MTRGTTGTANDWKGTETERTA